MRGEYVNKQFIDFAPDIDWRPIENMTPDQVQALLAKSKVYIDFGYHPGKDRIPREAAISGCVVITGRRGAAGNDIDINIPDEFKFDDNKLNLEEVIGKIHEVFDNFEAAHEKQADYRARILDDKNRFANEVAEAFGIKDTSSAGGIALPYFAEKTPALIKKFSKPLFIVEDNPKKISDGEIISEQKRNYLRLEEDLIEIITRDDAKFLYQEGRIKKFALLNPSDAELEDLKKFYEPAAEDILI